MPEHSTADQVTMRQRQESPPREGDQAAVQEQERRDPTCDSNLDVHLHRSESGDSLSSRLNAAQINSNLNRVLQYNEPPKADHTPIRPFLKTPRDEDEDLKIEAASGTPAIQKRHLSPPSPSDSSQTPALSNMDRKLRQNKPRLLLMGQRRSGKSSITSVVFHKLPPQETLFLESTTRIQKDSMHSFMDFQVWDFPGQLDYFDPTFDTTEIFSEIGALVWVIDAQDDYSESLNRLTTTILNLQTTFPHINVEVFVHKIDSLNDEFKADIFQDIVQRVGDELSDQGYINPNVSYHLTSIYDHSIFEAFSKVIQKLIPQLDTLETLLNVLVNKSGMAKAYLFDILSKIYVASDTRPIDMEVYEMCSDYIDVIVDITDLYSYERSERRVLGEQMEEAESSMTIQDQTMIYLKEINRYLCLVAYIKNPEAKDKKGLIDYNVHVIQDAINDVFERKWEKEDKNENGESSASDQKSTNSAARDRLEAQLQQG